MNSVNNYEGPRTENERELIDLIRNSKDPAKAMQIAVQLITDFLNRKDLA